MKTTKADKFSILKQRNADGNKSGNTHRSMRTQADTRVYANSVPIDIMSTNSLSSNIIAIKPNTKLLSQTYIQGYGF